MMKLINDAYSSFSDYDFSIEIKHTQNSTNCNDYLTTLENFFAAISDNTEIELELCGSWVWVSGNTKPIKETLKLLGLKWHSTKSMWYLAPLDESYKKKFYGKTFSHDQVQSTYGSVKFKGSYQAKINP